jgi:hypothetical protein
VIEVMIFEIIKFNYKLLKILIFFCFPIILKYRGTWVSAVGMGEESGVRCVSNVDAPNKDFASLIR